LANVYIRSLASGTADGSSWVNAYTTGAAALSAKAAGDALWVSEDHAETAAATITWTSPGTAAVPCTIICVNHLGTVPPVAADMQTTATVTATGAFDCVIAGGYAYVYGITFKGGSGAVTNTTRVGTAQGWWRLDSCSAQKGGTSGGPITIGTQDGSRGRVDLINTTMSFSAIGDSIQFSASDVYWSNTASALLGTIPTGGLLSSNQNGGSIIRVEGVDLSAAAGTLWGIDYRVSNAVVKDCKLNASVTACSATAFAGPNYGAFTLSRCDSGGTNYRNEKYNYCGNQKVNTTIVRTGGASDNTTAISWIVTTSANSNWQMPFEAMPIAIWNSTTGANRTCTIEGVWNAAALPNNDDIWVDFEYLGSALTPQGSFATDTKATILTANAAQTASTKAWDSAAAARANSTAYTLGQVYKVASNAGRIFFCTTAGTSASAEPAGIATAVDGGSVTDGTAVFRAAVRFSLAATASSPQPGQAGAVYAYVKAAKVSSTFYVDPLITLS